MCINYITLLKLTQLLDPVAKFVQYGFQGPSGKPMLNDQKEVLDLFDFLVQSAENVESRIAGLPLLPLASEEIGVVGKVQAFMSPSAINLVIEQNGKQLFLTKGVCDSIT